MGLLESSEKKFKQHNPEEAAASYASSAFARLPPEIVSLIVEALDDQSLTRLGATCVALATALPRLESFSVPKQSLDGEYHDSLRPLHVVHDNLPSPLHSFRLNMRWKDQGRKLCARNSDILRLGKSEGNYLSVSVQEGLGHEPCYDWACPSQLGKRRSLFGSRG